MPWHTLRQRVLTCGKKVASSNLRNGVIPYPQFYYVITSMIQSHSLRQENVFVNLNLSSRYNILPYATWEGTQCPKAEGGLTL
jgi:hypothetical protein